MVNKMVIISMHHQKIVIEGRHKRTSVGVIEISVGKVLERHILVVHDLASLNAGEVTLGNTNGKCRKAKPLERVNSESLYDVMWDSEGTDTFGGGIIWQVDVNGSHDLERSTRFEPDTVGKP